MQFGDDDKKEQTPFWLFIKRKEEDKGKTEGSEGKSAAEIYRERDEATETETLLESDICSLPLAPKAHLGSSILERHPVLQVSLGKEHGVLLSDAGIAFTWGDNRYGQLGRAPVLKEENGRPFPVLGLESCEVTQVSAGTHHCLALVAPGLVWSWGRNKDGQLGVGDYRDRTQPVEVCHPPLADGVDSTLQLGANKGGQIISINAGLDSSLAAAVNSNIWQWGQISGGFSVATAGDKTKHGGGLVQNRPYCIFRQDSFRSQMRSGKVSISSSGCKVLHQDTCTDKVRVETLVQGVQDMQDSINQERRELAELEKKANAEEVVRNPGEAEDELSTLQDTIGQLERDIRLCEKEIEAFGKSLESCDLRQAHNRKQLQQLQQQGTSLRDRQDQVSLSIYMAPKAGAERRKLDEQLTEVEEFVQANKNTRMTLLDQRAETDKEKQKILAQLAERRKLRDRFQRRLEIVKDLSRSSKASTTGSSDPLMKMLHKLCSETAEYFHRRASQATQGFLDHMKTRDADFAFLDQTEQKMKDLAESVSSSGQERAEHARLVKQMLVDLVNLRRAWCDMLQDRWASEGLDLSCFFDGSNKPSSAEQAFGDFDEDEDAAPSLLPSPQLPSLGFFGGETDTAPSKGIFGFLT